MVKMVSVSGGASGTFSSAYGSSDLFGRSIEATQGRDMLGETVERTQGRSQLQESLWETGRSAGLPPRYTLDAMRLAGLLRAASKANPWLALAEALAEGVYGWAYGKTTGPVAWDGNLPSGWCVFQSGACVWQGFTHYAVLGRNPACPPYGGGCTIEVAQHPLPIGAVSGNSEVRVGWLIPGGMRSPLRFGVPSGTQNNGRPTFSAPRRVSPLPVPAPPPAVSSEKSYGPGRVYDRRRGYVVPADTVVVGPEGVRRGPPSHVVLPPAAGEKEDKFKFPMHSALQEAFGSLTELSDAINCMAKNISFKTKSGKKYFPCAHKARLQDRIACVLSNLGGLDKKEMAKCLVLNEVQDQTIGRLASGANRHFFKSGYAPRSPHGLGFGGFSQRMR